MSVDTELGTLRKAIQDVFAPELSTIKTGLADLRQEVIVRAEATQKQIDQRFTAEREHTDQQFRSVEQRFTSEREHTDQQFAAIDHRFTAERHHTDLRFDAVIAEFRASTRTILEAFASFTAHNDVASLRVQCGELNVRVSLLEAEIRRK